MMKGSDIRIQEKKPKLFNEWERFTSTDGESIESRFTSTNEESIESYYHRFSKLMNDFKRNKHFPEKIASNLKFLNNLQPEWSRHVTIVHQTKDLHTADYTQLYDFLKYNQKEVDDLRAERLAKTQDPLALMANSNNPFNYPVFHPDLPSSTTSNIGTQSDKLPSIYLRLSPEVSSVEQGGGTVEQHSVTVEETRAYHESLFHNLPAEVKKVNTFNRKMKETNAELTTKLARYKNQEKCFEISQEKYDKLERCYQQSVYQEHCLTKKINALLLSSEVDESLSKHKALEWEIKRLLRAVVSQDIMSIVQNNSVVDTSNLQTKLERMKERFENYIIKKENEYAKLRNDWYKKYTLDPLPQKLENENVELEFQVRNYEKENAHLKTAYKNLEEKYVPNKPIKASVRTNPITVPQPHVITKKVVNSDSNGFSSTGVDFTTKTRRPQPRSNTKNDRVPLASNSIRIKNKEIEVKKPKKVGFSERLASPKPSKPRMYLRWSPTGKMFDIKGKLIASSESNGDNACASNPQEPTIKRFLNSTSSLGRNLEGVDLLKGNRTTNLYTINLYDMAFASPICLMARATSTKSWLWHQRLSHLIFDTINDLARNDLVTGLPKLKYHKEHLCTSFEQGKSKRASHPPKPVPNSK
ncbi:retrovirus-related pol polyprotein from transposon TNT 1-94 [Tanacetum coccineum]|uniref:Retrovirus-related pol polyprotein from transposon TNT 1-94 n=1 Tax=Tanacetum coccineum TaxID=301880 RepID=A0ABQ5I515_9ASTR